MTITSIKISCAHLWRLNIVNLQKFSKQFSSESMGVCFLYFMFFFKVAWLVSFIFYGPFYRLSYKMWSLFWKHLENHVRKERLELNVAMAVISWQKILLSIRIMHIWFLFCIFIVIWSAIGIIDAGKCCFQMVDAVLEKEVLWVLICARQ